MFLLKLRTTVRSFTNSSWQDYRFHLESGTKSTGKASSSHQTKWIDDLDLHTNNYVSSESAFTIPRNAAVSERDDIMPVGINVRRDVRVEQAPLQVRFPR